MIVLFGLILALLPVSKVIAKTTPAVPTPTPTKNSEYNFPSMTTYEMFWPLTAGKVPGDKFYNFKIWRDKLMGALMISPPKKSEYDKSLANKRLLEAERLVEIDRKGFFQDTLKQYWENLEKGFNLLISSQPSQQIEWLKEEYRKDLVKHLVVLERLKQRGDQEITIAVDQMIGKAKSLEDRLNQPI